MDRSRPVTSSCAQTHKNIIDNFEPEFVRLTLLTWVNRLYCYLISSNKASIYVGWRAKTPLNGSGIELDLGHFHIQPFHGINRLSGRGLLVKLGGFFHHLVAIEHQHGIGILDHAKG